MPENYWPASRQYVHPNLLLPSPYFIPYALGFESGFSFFALDASFCRRNQELEIATWYNWKLTCISQIVLRHHRTWSGPCLDSRTLCVPGREGK